jgi:hypothetical protein
MVPSKTFEKVGAATVARVTTHSPDYEYAITGNDLNDLAVLVQRFEYRFDDPNELRDWQNRLSLIVGNAVLYNSPLPEHPLPLGESGGRFRSLSLFEQGYVEAMFWTECNADNEELKDCTFDDLSEQARDSIHNDCRTFIKKADGLLFDFGEQAGHDFWLTRNHHGAGFWDRGLGAIGTALTVIAHSFGSSELYKGDDGQLYL